MTKGTEVAERREEERTGRGGWGWITEWRGRQKSKSTLDLGWFRRVPWLEIAFWLTVFVVWLFTAYHWIWLVAIAGRALLWWKQKGKAKIEESVPKEVREQVSQIRVPLFIWMAKMIVVFVGLLIALAIYPCLVLPVVVLGFWWIRRSGSPRRLKDGTLVLPNPYLWGVLGHPLAFVARNTVGPRGTRVGFKLGPLGKAEMNLPEKVSDVTVEVSLPWLVGAAKLIITDDGGDTDEAWVGTWASQEEMQNTLLEALTKEED